MGLKSPSWLCSVLFRFIPALLSRFVVAMRSPAFSALVSAAVAATVGFFLFAHPTVGQQQPPPSQPPTAGLPPALPPSPSPSPSPSPAPSSPAAAVASANVPSPAASPTPPPPAPEGTWSQVRVNDPYIAITFDDGPHPTLTPQLLDMLAQRHIHATFFIVGQMAKEHPEILQRALREGHEIANHSFTHPNLAKMSDDGVRRELNGTKDVITNAVNRPVTLMRPPYGSLSNAQRKWVHEDLGYKIILWDVDPLDWKRPGSEAVTRRILEGTHRGSIILAHDIHPGTVQAMPATLDGLLAKGFKFVTVSELLAMELPPEPKAARPAAAGTAKARPTPPPGVPDKLTGTPEGMATPAPTPTPTPSPAGRSKPRGQR